MSNIIKKAAVAAVEAQKPITMTQMMKNQIGLMQGEIARALPSVMTPERFTRIVYSTLSATPKLAECTVPSFLGAMMTAAQLGLEPNTPLGQAYLIPRYNGKHKQLEATFQIGYKGLIDLAYRSGQVSIIYAQVVRANDKFEYEFGLDPKLKHVPATSGRGEITYVYAVYRTTIGGYGFDVMSKADVDEFRDKHSESSDSGFSPWRTNYEEMAKKTVLKRVLKYAPLKTDFQRGLSTDGTVHTELSSDMTDSGTTIWGEGSVSEDDAPSQQGDADDSGFIRDVPTERE